MNVYRLLLLVLLCVPFSTMSLVYMPSIKSLKTVLIGSAASYTVYRVYNSSPLALIRSVIALAYKTGAITKRVVGIPQEISTITKKVDLLTESTSHILDRVTNAEELLKTVDKKIEITQEKISAVAQDLKAEISSKAQELHASITSIKDITKEAIQGAAELARSDLFGLEERLSNGFVERYKALDNNLSDIKDGQEEVKEQLRMILALLGNTLSPVRRVTSQTKNILNLL